jgi:hypothetical protein
VRPVRDAVAARSRHGSSCVLLQLWGRRASRAGHHDHAQAPAGRSRRCRRQVAAPVERCRLSRQQPFHCGRLG